VNTANIRVATAVKLTSLKKPNASADGAILRPPRLRDLIGTSTGSTARIVFAALCEYANPRNEMWPPGAPKSEGFAAWPSIQTLMSLTGLSDRAVQIALRDLEAANAIQCIYRSQGGGSEKGDRKKRTSTSCYLLTPNSVHREQHAEEIVTPNDVPPDEDVTPKQIHPLPRTTCPPPPEPGSPNVFSKGSNAAAAAAASRAGPLDKTEKLTTEDLAEIRRIEESTKIRIDGKDALLLKAGAIHAKLTLAHLRWFLADEKFPSARNPRAVLLTIAREFRERAIGIDWPDSLDAHPPPKPKGLTREEILQQR
jgi:hypothetical protein